LLPRKAALRSREKHAALTGRRRLDLVRNVRERVRETGGKLRRAQALVAQGLNARDAASRVK